MIEEAAKLVQNILPINQLAMVMQGKNLRGLHFGGLVDAHRSAAAQSQVLNIQFHDKPYQTIVAVIPEMYDEMWTAGKGAYKTEPVVAEGGRIILYAPHITSIAKHHPDVEKIGYHSMAYIRHHWGLLNGLEKSSLAHVTHVFGGGKMVNGVEVPYAERVFVTGIPEDTCRRINVRYENPQNFNLEYWEERAKSDPSVLFLPHAGEVLHRLRN